MLSTEPNPLNAISFAEALALLTKYADSGSLWWMEPRIELSRKNLKTALVIGETGQELVRRTLLSTVYPALIRRLKQQTEQPLPLPHASDIEYENEAQLTLLSKQGLQLRRQLPRLLNKMLRRQYLLEEAKLTTPAALEWSSRSEQLDKAACWEALRDMLNLTGSPSYYAHSSQLAPLVAAAAQAYTQIQVLLAAPYPGPANADRLDVAPNQRRRWYGPYSSSEVGLSWDPDNADFLSEDYREADADEKEMPDEEESDIMPYVSRDDIREELVEIRQQIDRLLARL